MSRMRMGYTVKRGEGADMVPGSSGATRGNTGQHVLFEDLEDSRYIGTPWNNNNALGATRGNMEGNIAVVGGTRLASGD